ncbi:DUF4349 domain-containing protein [Calderihabitans maritimus]|uniref:Anti-sigma-W factor RsiW n=1 Tax=Calderihabitans maritimus TaxID=1246530 RepID=A0A1Z5HSW7_9FIRM|nr:DUF4349 domain-containing protein [Calderihabitans maritimus]GAW92405.1 hypothetical protein TepRe1_1613 [Calderihabitans maritimus]
MKCEQIQELLSPYLDGVLEDETKAKVEEHLQHCSFCREELESLQATLNILHSLDQLTPPADFRSGLKKRLVKYGLPWYRRLGSAKWFAWGAAAAAVFIALIVAGSLVVRLPGVSSGELGGGLAMQKQEKVASQVAEPELGTAEYRKAASYDKQDIQIPPQGRIAGVEADRERGTEEVKDEYQQKVIKTAELTLEVKDIQAVSTEIALLAQRAGGYVTDSSVREEESGKSGYVTIRVPQERFEAVIKEIEGMGTVRSRHITGQDVTQEFYDTEARVRVLKKEEESLLELMDRAKSIEDIMKVRQELTRVRSEIEMLEGRLKYLSRMTDMSTIHVTLREQKTPDDQISTQEVQGVGTRALKGFIRTTNAIIKVLGEMVVGLGTALPVLILICVVVAVIWGGRIIYLRNKKE